MRAILVRKDGAVAIVDGLVHAGHFLGTRRRHKGGDEKERERPHVDLASLRARSGVEEGEDLRSGRSPRYLNIFTVLPHLEI